MQNENGERIDPTRNILDEIAQKTRQRINAKKQDISLEQLQRQANAMPKGNFAFETSLRQSTMGFICEVKKASPSKGLLSPDFPYLDIALDYEKAGATAISCLTEPYYFKGKDEYLSKIVGAVSIPFLRKDFFIDEYMIYEAKVLGASAILLICAILTDAQLQDFFSLANTLGLSAIFEVHDETEVNRAIHCGARIIGVNNRNLKTFATHLHNSIALRPLVPPETIFISESGIATSEDIALLAKNHVDAVLIGETLMRATNKKEALDILKGVL